MCGRYGFTASASDITERFDIETISFNIEKNYNITPTQILPVIERHSPNSLHLREWGIQPTWSKMFLINAQAEKLLQSNLWKKAFMENRCIIPASYFFEWKRLENEKIPYIIELKDKGLMGFAGINVSYQNVKGEKKEGFIIITTTPNKIMENIHNRMPAILGKKNEDIWLNSDSDPEKLLNLLKPYTDSEMESYPISSLVNSPKNNFPEILNPIADIN